MGVCGGGGVHFGARVERTFFFRRVRSGGVVERCDLRTFPIPLRDPSAANSIVLSSFMYDKIENGITICRGSGLGMWLLELGLHVRR